MPFPIPTTKQAITASSATALYSQGDEGVFETDEGFVHAVYCKNANAGSLAAGFVVAHAWDNDGGPFAIDTAPLANVSAMRANVVGVLLASMTTGGFGWVAYRGPVTNALLAQNVASNALLYVTANTAARLASVATSINSVASNQLYNQVVMGRYGATASTISRASTTQVAGHYVNLFWK
jgi:hypothetical protein